MAVTPFQGFSREPRVRAIATGLIQTEDACEWVDEPRGVWVLVPRGFVCDGASVPSWGWPLLRAGWIELLPPGLLHDYLYRTDAVIRVGGRKRLAQVLPVPSRRWADAVMRDAMLTRRGVTRGDARLAYAALRLGGFGSYQKKPVGWLP